MQAGSYATNYQSWLLVTTIIVTRSLLLQARKSFEKALETGRNLAMVTRAKLLAEMEVLATL